LLLEALKRLEIDDETIIVFLNSTFRRGPSAATDGDGAAAKKRKTTSKYRRRHTNSDRFGFIMMTPSQEAAGIAVVCVPERILQQSSTFSCREW
jgi:hypothetical protein